MAKPSDVNSNFERRVARLTRENFSIEKFMNKMQDIEVKKRIDFIRFCIDKDLFNDKYDDDSMTPYLLLWCIADKDLYPISQSQREAYADEVVKHYKLSKEGYYEVYEKMNPFSKDITFKPIEAYLK